MEKRFPLANGNLAFRFLSEEYHQIVMQDILYAQTKQHGAPDKLQKSFQILVPPSLSELALKNHQDRLSFVAGFAVQMIIGAKHEQADIVCVPKIVEPKEQDAENSRAMQSVITLKDNVREMTGKLQDDLTELSVLKQEIRPEHHQRVLDLGALVDGLLKCSRTERIKNMTSALVLARLPGINFG